MIANILIAVGFFGIGFFTGMFIAASRLLKTYKAAPKEVILLLDEYASQI